jgi:hypothetical protein
MNDVSVLVRDQLKSDPSKFVTTWDTPCEGSRSWLFPQILTNNGVFIHILNASGSIHYLPGQDYLAGINPPDRYKREPYLTSGQATHYQDFLRDHVIVKSVEDLGGGTSLVTVGFKPNTRFTHIISPITLVIGKSFTSATVNNISCTIAGSNVTIPTNAYLTGSISAAWDSLPEMTSPDTQTFALKVTNGSGSAISNAKVYVGENFLFEAGTPVTVSLNSGETKTIQLPVTTKLVDFPDFAYGVKSITIITEYDSGPDTLRYAQALHISIAPMLIVRGGPNEATPATPLGRSYFHFYISRQTLWDGPGPSPGPMVATYVLPASGTTTGRVEASIDGPYKVITQSVPFSFAQDEETGVTVIIENTNPIDSGWGELKLRFFIDGKGEISPIHVPIPVRIYNALRFSPKNDQGLVLFFDYEGPSSFPTVQMNPNFYYSSGGTNEGGDVDGVFGMGVSGGNTHGDGQWLYTFGELSGDSGSVVWWLRETYDHTAWQYIFQHTAGSADGAVAGPYDSGMDMGMNYEAGDTDTIFTWLSTAGGRAKHLRFQSPPYDGQYHHFAVVWNIPRHIYKIYLDGQKVVEADSSDNTVVWIPTPMHNQNRLNSLMFSKYSRGMDKDQLAIYHRNLSENEISDIMTNGVDTSSSKAADPNNPDNLHPIRPVFSTGGSTIGFGSREDLDEFKDMGIDVWPNPFSTDVDINLSMKNSKYQMKNAKLEILNLKGEILHFEFCNLNFSMGEPVRWNAINYPAGIYIVKVKTGNRVLTRKITLVR